MLCSKSSHKIGFGILFSVLLSVFFSLFCLDTSYAVSDYTYIHDSSNYSSSAQFCGGSSGRNCSDYNFLYVYFTGDFSSLRVTDVIKSRIAVNNQYTDFSFSPRVLPLLFADISDFNYFGLNLNSVNFSFPSGSSIVYVLSESNPLSSVSGTVSITSNGLVDVSSYQYADVNVPQNITTEGQYHDDLIDIKISIYTCGAILLVLYFFYCIYRMIIKSTGGQ